ncbi:MAG: hypothetical protein D6767_09690 [Candidatus Hydrogenedentota bacterium]|nr:MAG: hypothetical protein D6767_09690 [Candidatus Hydrogenedentota bacterium]
MDAVDQVEQKWDKISGYLEKLAAENEKLEKEIIAMRERRKARKEKMVYTPKSDISSKEQSYTPEIRLMKKITSDSKNSLKKVNAEIQGLITDLEEIKIQRNSLENKIKKTAPYLF